jgi:hypothetical protein
MEDIKTPENLNKKDELRKAILEGDLEKVCRLLEEINIILIGERGTYSLPKTYKEDIEKLLTTRDSSVKIYLGDGGTSRLIIRKSENQIGLEIGGLSSDKVKKKWVEI